MPGAPGIRLALQPGTHRAAWTSKCRLAGSVLSTSGSIPGLTALLPVNLDGALPPGRGLDESGELLPGCPLTAQLGDDEALVEARTSSHGLRIDAEGFGSVRVRADGAEVLWLPEDPAARRRPELVLGPGLVLALAFQGVFCLHASAVLGPEGAVVFAGPSRAGKSTLAARLAAAGDLPRLADDVLPLRADASGVCALPHFPQLKLSPAEQYPPAAAAAVPVAHLYLLTGCRPEDRVVARPLPPSVAALAVCAQTVATRLFPARLLERLLPFAAELVAGTRVSELSYPRRPGAVAEVLRLIREA